MLNVPTGCIDTNGMVYTWGYGSYWQLGTGQTLDAGMPHKVPPKPTMTTLCAEALPCLGKSFVHIAARSRFRILNLVCQGTCFICLWLWLTCSYPSVTLEGVKSFNISDS